MVSFDVDEASRCSVRCAMWEAGARGDSQPAGLAVRRPVRRPGCRLACFAWESAPLSSRHSAGSLRKITFFDFSRSRVRMSGLPLRHSFLPVHITPPCSLTNPRFSSGTVGHIAARAMCYSDGSQGGQVRFSVPCSHGPGEKCWSDVSQGPSCDFRFALHSWNTFAEASGQGDAHARSRHVAGM